tara:strand:- start:1863 stop:3539 length:1677 start_codon:yes stop_codon:yes gene_type:complete
MKNFKSLLIGLSLIMLFSCSKEDCVDADLVLINANIYTGDESRPKASSIGIKGKNIAFLSSDTSFKKNCGSTKVIDLSQSTVFPGFSDAHAHLKGIGYREMTLNLQGINSLEDTLGAIKKYVESKNNGDWVVGRGWIEKVWPEKRFPNKHDLDKFSPNNPVVIERADGHAVVANSLALQLAGIKSDSVNPQGGFIEKDEEGNPTGLLVDRATYLVERLIPKNSKEKDKEAFLKGLKRYASLGWTQIHVPGGDYRDIELLKEIKQEGNLIQRIYFMVSDGKPAIRLLEEGPTIDADHFLTIRSIKMYADGALGSRGAALIDKYKDYEGKGVLIFLEEETIPKLEKALEVGIQIGTHAIGDLGNQVTLDWYQRAFETIREDQRAISSPRWRIEHSQIITPEDQNRFFKLGVIPSMQPSHAIGDLHFAVDRLGMERINNAYAWRDLIDKGLIIAGGSDAPVEIGDPRIEFYAATSRKDLTGFHEDGWNLDQKVTREEALKMFTIWPAIAAFEEDIRGTLEVGKLADITVFNKDLMTIPEEEIMSAKNILTILDGKIIYQDL